MSNDDVPLLDDTEDDVEQLLGDDGQQPVVEAVFVATFDVKQGNVIEFQMPEAEYMPLTGVEYKAIPSGSHHVHKDFVYFRHENKFGLACLARADVINDEDGSALSVIDQTQRGMRIKSVGILTASVVHIQFYLAFLQSEARHYLNQSTPNYERLQELLVDHQQLFPLTSNIHNNSFAEFVQQFDASIFPLARLILLGKRILLYSPSPIGFLCNAVYFIHTLNRSVQPLFFVTVFDIPMLNNEHSYIACTTEKIFQEKTTTYDAFLQCDISNRIIFHTNDDILRSIVKVTRHDRQRQKKLMTWSSLTNWADRFVTVFNRLSQSTDSQQLTTADFHSLDLDPRSDRLFLNEYIRLHHLPHVTIGSPHLFLFSSSCCPCLRFD